MSEFFVLLFGGESPEYVGMLVATHAICFILGSILAWFLDRKYVRQVAEAAEVAFSEAEEAEQDSRDWERIAIEARQDAYAWKARWTEQHKQRLQAMAATGVKVESCPECEAGVPCAAAAACCEGLGDDQDIVDESDSWGL